MHVFSNLFLPQWGRNLCTILFGKLWVFHSLLQRDFYTLNCWVSSFFGKLQWKIQPKKNIICHFTKDDCFDMPMPSSVANVWLLYIWIFTAHMITLTNYLLKFTLTIWILKITGNKGLSSSANHSWKRIKKNINKINRRSHDKSVMTGSACKHVKGAR